MADVTLEQNEPYPLEIWGGKSFELTCEWFGLDGSAQEPIALDPETDSIVGQIRRASGSQLLAAFDCEITDGPNGRFVIRLTPEQTAALSSKANYEVKLTVAGEAVGVLHGPVIWTKGLIP